MDNVGRYDSTGNAVWVRQCPCAKGSGVAASAGRVWLTEPTAKSMTWLGSVDGRTTGRISPRSAQNGFPADVAAAPDGTVFGTDLIGSAVFAWPPPYLPGDFETWTMLESSGPFRIAAGAQPDGATLVAVMHSDGLVRVHRPDGTLVARFVVPGEPIDLTFGDEGLIYFLDADTAEVSVYEPGPPPTSTPVPTDLPVVSGSCKVTGSRTISPTLLTDFGTTEVSLSLAAECPEGAVVGSDIALIIDRSQSMRKGTPLSQMDAAKAAAHRFLAGLDLRHHQATVIGFSDVAEMVQPLTADLAALDAAVDGLSEMGSGTDIRSGLHVAMDHILKAGRPNALPALILLTDGEPTLPIAPEADTAALVEAERARARRAYIVTVGLGEFVDSLLLETIASTPEDFYYSPSVVDLNHIYETILRVIQGIQLSDLVIEDTPAQPFVLPVVGSSAPPALLVNDTLQWTRPVLPSSGLSFTHTIKASAPGRDSIGPARAIYTDADGTRRTYRFDEPILEVVLGTYTPAPAGTATAPPPVPPAPATPGCPANESWFLSLAVFPDTVGQGPYTCPGCNDRFDSGDVWSAVGEPIGPTTVSISDTSGHLLWVGEIPSTPGGVGRALARLCSPPPYRVQVLRIPAGYQSCPNSPIERIVDAKRLQPRRRAELRFGLWGGCGTPDPFSGPSPRGCP